MCVFEVRRAAKVGRLMNKPQIHNPKGKPSRLDSGIYSSHSQPQYILDRKLNNELIQSPLPKVFESLASTRVPEYIMNRTNTIIPKTLRESVLPLEISPAKRIRKSRYQDDDGDAGPDWLFQGGLDECAPKRQHKKHIPDYSISREPSMEAEEVEEDYNMGPDLLNVGYDGDDVDDDNVDIEDDDFEVVGQSQRDSLDDLQLPNTKQQIIYRKTSTDLRKAVRTKTTRIIEHSSRATKLPDLKIVDSVDLPERDKTGTSDNVLALHPSGTAKASLSYQPQITRISDRKKPPEVSLHMESGAKSVGSQETIAIKNSEQVDPLNYKQGSPKITKRKQFVITDEEPKNDDYVSNDLPGDGNHHESFKGRIKGLMRTKSKEPRRKSSVTLPDFEELADSTDNNALNFDDDSGLIESAKSLDQPGKPVVYALFDDSAIDGSIWRDSKKRQGYIFVDEELDDWNPQQIDNNKLTEKPKASIQRLQDTSVSFHRVNKPNKVPKTRSSNGERKPSNLAEVIVVEDNPFSPERPQFEIEPGREAEAVDQLRQVFR